MVELAIPSCRSVFVVAPPPHVRLGLRPALGRILPVFLPAERSDVEVGPKAPQKLVAAPGSEVGAKDLIAVAQEDAGARGFTLVGRHAEIRIEVASRG